MLWADLVYIRFSEIGIELINFMVSELVLIWEASDADLSIDNADHGEHDDSLAAYCEEKQLLRTRAEECLDGHTV